MKRAISIAAVVAAIAGVAATAAAGPDAKPPTDGVFERDQVEVGPAKRPIKTITVENALGDVRVEGHDGKTVQIIAVKRAPDDDTLDRLRVSLVPDPDGAVRIVTAVDGGREARPVSRGSVRIDVIIRAPRDAKVDARVHDGKLELFNMDAGGELDAGDGAISVENVAGSVFARSVAGDQSFKSVFGIVDAQAVTADLDLDTVRGDRLTASVHAGKIAGRRVTSRHVELRTTRGDIVLDGTPTAGGDLVIASLRGDVSVTMHGGLPIRVHATGAHVTMPTGGTPDAIADDTVLFGPNPHSAAAALEIRSRFGTVSFAFLQ